MHFFFGSISIWTAAYHPKASSLVDCFHHQLKISLHVMVHSSHWEEALPMVLFCIRMSRSMAEIPYKSTLCIPGPPSYSPSTGTAIPATHHGCSCAHNLFRMLHSPT